MSPSLRTRLAAFALCAVVLSPAGPARADRRFTKPVAKGVTLRQAILENPAGRRIINVVEANLKQPGLTVGAELGQDDVENDGKTAGREAVSAFARRKGATVAVNGDFFIGGATVGMLIHDGELVTFPYMNRSVCAILPGNRVVFDVPMASGEVQLLRNSSGAGGSNAPLTFPLANLNRKRGTNVLVLYTPTYGPKTLTNDFGTEVVLSGVKLPLKPGWFRGTVEDVRVNGGGTPLRRGTVVLSGHGSGADFLKNLQPGDQVRLILRVRSPKIPDWGVVRQAIGGGPFLVRGGKVSVDAAEQKFQPDVVLGRAPRTAVGLTRDGRLLVVAVDGRQPMSAGMTLSEMATLMVNLGSETAMNFDGGGSTTMAVKGLRVSSPSDGWERSVAAMFTVRAPALGPDSPSAQASLSPLAPHPFQIISEMDGPISSGQSLAFEMRDENGEPLSVNAPILWGIEGPIGFVDQSGTFTAGKAGSGRVMAKWGNETASIDVRVAPSRTPATLTANWSPADPVRPMSSILTVTVADASGNRIPGIPVTLAVPDGASADALSRPTDDTGIAVFQVAWGDTVTSRRVMAKAGTLSFTTPLAPTAPPP